MKVLIACEYSGTVRDAFIAAGHAALVAAAPDMLAMLAKLVRAVERLPIANPLDGLAEDARAVMARATGNA